MLNGLSSVEGRVEEGGAGAGVDEVRGQVGASGGGEEGGGGRGGWSPV